LSRLWKVAAPFETPFGMGQIIGRVTGVCRLFVLRGVKMQALVVFPSKAEKRVAGLGATSVYTGSGRVIARRQY